jgi:hypothetical protein
MAKRNIHPEVTNWKIFTVAGGFYYFGEEIEAPEGYIAFTKASMFGGFSGGKGLPGVQRMDPSARVTLDRFTEDAQILVPISAVYAITDCGNLYEFEGTTLR